MLMELKPQIKFPFDWDKGISLLQLILCKVGGKFNTMSVLKLAFFADRCHVRNHARPISFDRYFAFPFGVAGGGLKDILACEDVFVSSDESKIVKYGKYEVVLSIDKVDESFFSKSELRAIEFAILNFAPYAIQSDFALSDISHAYPEWWQYADLFKNNKTKREDVDYRDFLKNADTENKFFKQYKLSDPFPRLSPTAQEELESEMLEYSQQLV